MTKFEKFIREAIIDAWPQFDGPPDQDLHISGAGMIEYFDGIRRDARKLLEQDLSIGECIRSVAVPNDDPYVVAARKLCDDDFEIDDQTTTSVGEGGAWVLGWTWISDDDAGIEEVDDEP